MLELWSPCFPSFNFLSTSQIYQTIITNFQRLIKNNWPLDPSELIIAGLYEWWETRSQKLNLRQFSCLQFTLMNLCIVLCCKLFRVIHCEASFPVAAAGACFVFQNLFSFDSLVCITDIELSESNSSSCHAEQPTLHSVQLSLLRLWEDECKESLGT